MYQKLTAEALGTFTLAFAVLASLQVETMLPTPVIAGLVLGLFVYTIGSISGSHINPAVTLGLWAIKQINLNEALQYIVAQLIGALLAFGIATFFFAELSLGLVTESGSVFWAELIGAAIFTFGIAGVVYGKVSDVASGLVIGGSLLLGIVIAAHLGSAGILNPAVALALDSISASYVLGSILGGIAGMMLYRAIKS